MPKNKLYPSFCCKSSCFLFYFHAVGLKANMKPWTVKIADSCPNLCLII